VRVLVPAVGRQGTGILMRSREGTGEGVKGPRQGGGEPGEGAPDLAGAVRSQVSRHGSLSSPPAGAAGRLGRRRRCAV
jgi:hypothetical protein